MKKIIAGIVIVIALIVGYNVLFSDSSFEKDLKESLPYDLTHYTFEYDWRYSLLEDMDYALEVKDLKIERHVRNGNYDSADCILVLEDENLKKTMYVTLYSTKYNNGWQVDSWTETQDAIVMPKKAPDKLELENRASSEGYENLTVMDESTDFSGGFYYILYDVNDVFDYVTFTGTISIEAEFKESYSDDEGYSYYWVYSKNYNTTADWTVEGKWTLECDYGYTEININNINEYGISGDATNYQPVYEMNNFTGKYKSFYDDNISYDMTGSHPFTAGLTVRGGGARIDFTYNSYEGYDSESTGYWSNKCRSVTYE